MDILSILGLLLAFGAILGGQVLEGGHIGSILLPVAFLIVMGGTLGAVMVNYPMPIFKKAMACTKMVFFNPKVGVKALITQIVELANLSRKQGLLALEGKMKTILVQAHRLHPPTSSVPDCHRRDVGCGHGQLSHAHFYESHGLYQNGVL